MKNTGGLPNIILIVCDTLGAKHMSLYGYGRKTTPGLERLVEEEGFTLYGNCWSTSCWTSPAHASLFTGLYPSEHGTHEECIVLSEHLMTLPEILSMAGYRTVGISSNGLVSEFSGYARCFDWFIGLDRYHPFRMGREVMDAVGSKGSLAGKAGELIRLTARGGDYCLPFKYGVNLAWSRLVEKYHFHSALGNAAPYTQKALRTAREFLAGAEGPLFLFINLMQTHNNYRPPAATRGTWSDCHSPFRRDCQEPVDHYKKSPYAEGKLAYFRDLYDEEVLYLDGVLCDFYEQVKRDGDIFAVTSDHGENFGEDGHFGHMVSLTTAVCKVPLLIRYPGQAKPEFSGQLCQINDLFSTFGELAGSPVPPPESSVPLVSSRPRRSALMEIVRPERWLKTLRDREKYDLCFKKEVFL